METARARAAKVFEIYGTLRSYRAMMDREGADGPAELAIIGKEDTVSARLEELSAAGVTEFVAGEFMPRDDRTRTFQLLQTSISRPIDAGVARPVSIRSPSSKPPASWPRSSWVGWNHRPIRCSWVSSSKTCSCGVCGGCRRTRRGCSCWRRRTSRAALLA